MKPYKIQDNIINLEYVVLVSVKSWSNVTSGTSDAESHHYLQFHFDRTVNGRTCIEIFMKSKNDALDTLFDIYAIMKEK